MVVWDHHKQLSIELIVISQEMDQPAGLIVDIEEDLGLSELAPENDQRTSVFLLHLELIRFELGFLGVLDAEFLVPPPGIPMRMVRCDELLSLGSRSDRKPGLYATGFSFQTGGLAATTSMICHAGARAPLLAYFFC